MKIRHRALLFIFIFSLALTSFASFAEAALSSKYESSASGGNSAAAAPAAAPSKPAPAATVKTGQQVKNNTQTTAQAPGGEQVTTYKLPQKYLDAINKEHARFCKAAVDAEMGLRYFFKTGYDATRGKKAPSQEQIKAMRFEIQLLMKDLNSSAKRYARNVAFARAALDKMSDEERTFFAIIFSHITATPAFADGQSLSSSMANFEANLNNVGVQSSTVNVGINNISPSDFGKIPEAMPQTASAWERFASSRGAHIGAAGAKLLAGTALTLGTIFGGAALVSTAPVTGGVMVIGGILAGGFEFVSATIGFVDAVQGKETDEKSLESIEKASKYISLPVTIVNPGKGVVEGVTTVLEGTKDFWVPWMTESDDPENPGNDGAEAVKKAAESSGGGDGGGGGGGGGGGCGC